MESFTFKRALNLAEAHFQDLSKMRLFMDLLMQLLLVQVNFSLVDLAFILRFLDFDHIQHFSQPSHHLEACNQIHLLQM